MQEQRLSGKVITILLLAGCLSLVAIALVKRSFGTSQVRGLFGPQGAKLIQRAEKVQWRRVPASIDGTNANADWREISRAQGLIHLRATLVDDRYFEWSTKSQFSQGDLVRATDRLRLCAENWISRPVDQRQSPSDYAVPVRTG
jgi:hypothetical protein